MGLFDLISEGASSLWHGATSAVSDAGSAISDAASGAYHFAADTATSVYDAGVSVANTASGYIHRGEEALTGGVHWVEDEVNAGSHALAGYVKDVPVLGSIAEGAADAATFVTQVGGGIVGGAASLVGGAANAVLHPIDTARGLETMAEHVPILGTGLKLGHGLLDAATGDASLSDVVDRTFNPVRSMEDDAKYWGRVGSAVLDPYKQSMAEGRYGEIAGRGAFDIAMLLSGAGEAEGAATAGEAANAAHVAEGADAARAAEAAEAARIGEGAEAARGAEAADVARAEEASAGLEEIGPAGQPQVLDEAEAAEAGLRTAPSNVGQLQGREGRIDALTVNEFDPNLPAHVRGWLKNERRLVEQGRRAEPRTPPGMVMAHGRATPAREGFDYSNARLQDADLNQLEETVRRRAGRP